MKHVLLLLLLSTLSFGQKSGFGIKIDSISSADNEHGERKYKLYYHVFNSGKKTVSVLLKPTHFSSIQYGSLSNAVHYRIYEENKPLDLGDAFDRAGAPNSRRIEIDVSDPDKIENSKKILRDNFTMTEAQIDEYIRSGIVKDSTITYRKRDILSEILTLKPAESREFSQVFFWDRQPYFKYDENEFYLDTQKQHYIELVVMSVRDAFRSKMPAEDFEKLNAWPDFVTGVFVSNRVLIDFSD